MVSRQPFELLSSFPLLLSKWTVYKLYWSIRGVKAEIKKLPEHKNVLFVLSEQYMSYATWPLLRVYFSFESSRKEKKKKPTLFKPHFPVWSWSFSIIALSFRGVDTEHSIDHFTRSDHKKSSLQWSFTFAPGMVSKLKKTRHIESWLSPSLLSPAEPIAISMQFVYNVGWSFHAAEIQLMPELQNDFWNKPADQCHQAYCFGFWLIVAIMCVHSAWDLTTTNHSFKCHCWSFSKTHGSSFCHLGLVVWVSVCVKVYQKRYCFCHHCSENIIYHRFYMIQFPRWIFGGKHIKKSWRCLRMLQNNNRDIYETRLIICHKYTLWGGILYFLIILPRKISCVFHTISSLRWLYVTLCHILSLR